MRRTNDSTPITPTPTLTPARAPALNPSLTRALTLAISLTLTPLACDSTPGGGPDLTPEEAACSTFCAASADRACADPAECQSDCMALFDLGCATLLVDLLDCLGDNLSDDCSPRDPEGNHACATLLGSYDTCVSADFGGAFGACGPSTGESADIDPACVGALDCDAASFEVACDEAGDCACSKDGAVVGTCANLVTSAYFCPPHAGCCAALFAPD